MLLRENLVSAFQWSLTDPAGTELAIGATATDVPADLLKNDLVSSPFLRFVYWRCDRIKVRFQLVASRFHQGRALVYFVPSCLPKTQFNTGPRHPTRATQLQHGFLDPANGTVLDFEIPFVFHKGFVDLVFGDSLGQLHFQVLNQLQAATGASTSVEVKVFVSFEGSHFRVPREGGLSFNKLMLDQQAKKLGLKLVSEYDMVEATKESGLFSEVGKGLDELVESIIPAEITGAVAGILLDKPAVTEYPEPLVAKDAQYMSASRGIEKLERMTLEPTAQYLTSDQFGSSVDETDMKYLLKKPVFLSRFNWKATDVVGTILYTTPVSPAHLITSPAPVLNTAFNATIIGFLANMFTYWRGSIVLIFQFVGTAFHEGRIDFCNHVAQLVPPADYITAMSQYVNSQTIRNTNNTVEIRVPFHSDIPWKRVWTGEPLSDTPVAGTVRATDYITGSFTVRVAVPLKSPNNVANNVDVNVFVCAGDDFEFHTMSLYGDRYNIYDIPDRERKEKKKKRVEAIKQAGDLNTDDKTDKQIICLGVGDVYTRDLNLAHFGETYTNLREMCKRYVHYDRLTGTFADFTTIFFGRRPENTPGFIGVLLNSYRLFRGPMNFKMQVIAIQDEQFGTNNCTFFVTSLVQRSFSAAPITAIPLLYSSGFPGTSDHRAPPLVRFSNKQVAEYQIPFQSIYHSLLTILPEDDVSSYYDNALLQFDQLVGANAPNIIPTHVDIRSEIAFADETRVGCFMGFPLLLMRASALWPNAAN